MRRRQFLAAPLAAAGARAAGRRTNILLITGDDLGLQLGCYGEKRIATPNLDRLAASGVRGGARGLSGDARAQLTT